MGENVCCKARMAAGGHRAVTPAAFTYTSVVSRNSVRICLTIAALNDLLVLACNIKNTHLTAPCRETMWTIAVPELGPDAGKICSSHEHFMGLNQVVQLLWLFR